MIKSYNTPEFYDEIYSNNPDKWDLPFRDKFMYESISPHVSNPSTCLDIGCGNGHSLAYLSNQWPDTKMYGIDISSVAIDYASKKHRGIIFRVDNMGTNKVPMCKVVLCMGVMEHFKSIVPSLTLLGAHGHLIYLEIPDNLLSDKVEGWRRSRGGQFEWHLKRDTWERYITEAGYEIVSSIKGPSASTRFVWILKT